MSAPTVPPALRLRSLVGGDAEFAQDAAGFDAGFGEMACRGFADAVRAALAESDLHGGVAVVLGGLDLGDAVVRHVHHGHRDGIAIVGENAGHADLTAD